MNINYQPSHLLLTVSDNGIGIATEVIERGGRHGHFGIVGMQERARRIKSTFYATNRSTGGTEISLSVPARVAYASTKRGIISSLRRLLIAEA